MVLKGLGEVKLDCFIVGSKTGRPGGGHWATVRYNESDWVRVLGGASLLQ